MNILERLKSATDEQLHALAREQAALLVDPDRKQLRFNEIVAAAKLFYNEPEIGVKEIVASCERSSPLYVKGNAMAATLKSQYAWMIDLASSPRLTTKENK